MSVFGNFQKSFVAGFFRKFFRVIIINPENEPLDENIKSYVACINHSSNWDPILIGACMHRPLRFIAKAELFRIPGLRSLIQIFGAYSVKRDSADVGSVKATISILENGEVVGMFPQGTRAKRIPPDRISPKNGVAMVAHRAKAGILPVTVIAKGYKVKALRKTIIVFGEYIPFESLEKMAETDNGEGNTVNINNNIELYRKITNRVYGIILENYKIHDTLNKKK
jgi:1-acyl-sn-glycerol-3-phosphate acyltransferase